MNNNHRITLNTNKNIIVEFTNERIIPASGLAVVGALLGKSDFIKKLNRMDVTSNRSQHQIKNGDIVLTYLGMLCMGKPYFEAFFIIKRKLRRESTDDWFEMAKQYCRNVTSPRDGKTVYIGSDWKTVTSKQFNAEYTLRTGYEITERTIDKYGQFNLVPDIEVEAWWTNLGDPDEEIISLYHAHGECEQFHSEVKTDMDLERLPSGKFATNALILELGMIAYNILRMIGQGTIGGRAPRQKRDVKRRRLRTVISNLIMMAGHITMHARQLITGLGRSNIWRHIFSDICQKYAVTNS